MMKTLFRTIAAFTLSGSLCAGAFASQPVSDADVSHKLDQLNATTQVIDSRLQQIFTALNLSAQNGTCWLDGKAFSQGAVTRVAGHASACGVQPKTGWPQWQALPPFHLSDRSCLQGPAMPGTFKTTRLPCRGHD